jgi:hypothetical protein
MFKTLFKLVALGLAIQPAVLATLEDGIEFDLDAHTALPDSTVDLAKRVYGGALPTHMYPFVAVIASDIPWSDAQTKMTAAGVNADTISRIGQTYGNYSHPYCAGAVLSKDWIITSAYCMTKVQDNGLTNIRIYANRKNLRPTRREAWIDFRLEDQTTPANSVFINKFYDVSGIDNDIAMLKVVPYHCTTKDGVETCTKIKKLFSARYTFPRISRGDANSSWTGMVGSTMWTGGYGLTGNEYTEYTQYGDAFYLMRNAPSYKVIRTSAVSRQDCADHINVPVNTTNVCTRWDVNQDNNLGGPASTEGASLCNWDYGAPLFSMKLSSSTNLPKFIGTKASFNAKLVGIFSNFFPDTGVAQPQPCQNAWNVYSYIPAYCDWIREVTNQDIQCTEDSIVG